MAQTTTSKLIVSLGPPRPSVSFTSTATCATSTVSGVTACVGTPLCLTSPQTVVGTAITFDAHGLPFFVCTNTTSRTSESTTSSPVTTSGIASVSLHSPLDSSSSGTAGSTTSIKTTSTSISSSPSTSQSTNAAGHHASLPSGILIPVLLAWLGTFAAFYPG
ncbi:hypothetical protein BKA65DRAFT_599123 [Rhexocercosporidium sp. MPI-PUGE-AT-0058]|nr:hypothetical protein BKA65DRAFT_599123 [Rhexocercosporidium sp. MPI-PUGE-AT-0058]